MNGAAQHSHTSQSRTSATIDTRDTAPMEKLLSLSREQIALLREQIAKHGESLDTHLHQAREQETFYEARLRELREHNARVTQATEAKTT
jgi:hypothetical protein